MTLLNEGDLKLGTSWQEAAMFNTTLIKAIYVGPPHKNAWEGTGFFVAWMADDGIGLFLISNKHVLEADPKLTYRISLHRRSTERSGFPLEVGGKQMWVATQDPITVDLPWADQYFQHPIDTVDLACICCTQLLDMRGVVLVPFSQTRILVWERSNLYPSQEVLFVGYPDGIRDRMHNLPVARTGTLASMPHVHFNGQPDFLIDAQVWAGSSGSPVFVRGTEASESDSFSLVGVIHSTRLNGSDANIGLGYAVKSSEVSILIEEAVKSGRCNLKR